MSVLSFSPATLFVHNHDVDVPVIINLQLLPPSQPFYCHSAELGGLLTIDEKGNFKASILKRKLVRDVVDLYFYDTDGHFLVMQKI